MKEYSEETGITDRDYEHELYRSYVNKHFKHEHEGSRYWTFKKGGKI